MKGATKIDNMSWLNNLGGDLLIQRGLPIHEHDSRALNSLESRKSLLMAKAFAAARSKKQGKNTQSSGLISSDSGQVKVYSQIYFGPKMWKLTIEQIPLSLLKPQFELQGTKQISMQYYSFFAYLLLKGHIFPKFSQLQKFLSDSPSALLDDGNLTQKVTRLLSSLQKFDIDSKHKLAEMWSTSNSLFLQDSICLWISDKSKIKEIKS